MSRAFVAAWLLGAGAMVLGQWWEAARVGLIPAGLVVAVGGVALLRRSGGFIESAVLRAARARLAGVLLLVLGVAWMATGAAEALA